MGGVGKTTLAKRVYNHEEVKRRFDRCAWVYVSQSNRLGEVLREIAKGLMEIPSAEVDAFNERELQERLLRFLEHKRYMLVFDDMWDKRMWDVIRLILPRNDAGSRVMITTRNGTVLSSVVDVKSYVHKLDPLSPEESWALFSRKAFATRAVGYGCPEELRETAEGIVRRCSGLPLAVVAIGHMMSRKERNLPEWRHVLESISREFWNADDDGVRRALLFSYRDLPYALRLCFLFCSVFPADYEISRKRLIRLWLAEGFVQEERGQTTEDTAEKYLMELINRNMIQISMTGSGGKVKACRVHDLLHQLAISISHEDSFSTVCDHQTTRTPKIARRVSMQKNYNSSGLKKVKWRQIRSLLMFGTSQPLHCLTNFFRNGLGLLRVLDLEDSSLAKLPAEVGDLIHLRYLSLKGTAITKLPKSLKNLHNLQTLDVRRTNIQKLSFDLRNMKQLRHLEMKQLEHCIKAPKGVSSLGSLQIVTGLQATGAIAHEIRKLTKLRKLSISHLKAEDATALCMSINNLSSLSSLSILSIDEPKPLDLCSLTPFPSLHKLHIAGHLGSLPSWFCAIKSLTKLRLGLCHLSEDPMPVLKELRSLVFLQLYEAFDGREMRCSNPGFNKLKILILTGLENLEEWELEEGTMPCIQELWIMSCPKLEAIPTGIKFLVTLQKLRLVQLSEVFVRRVRSTLDGEDFQRVRKIPSVQVIER